MIVLDDRILNWPSKADYGEFRHHRAACTATSRIIAEGVYPSLWKRIGAAKK